MGEGLLAEDPFRLFPWFEQKGVVMMAGVKYEEITDRGVTITTKEGRRETIEADSILIALPLIANPELAKSMQGKAGEVYQIGDCKQAGFMHDAIFDGAAIGHTL